MQKRRSYFSYILLAVFVLAGALYLARPLLIADRTESSSVSTGTVSPSSSGTSPNTASGIVKEGEVAFLQGGKQVRKIDVEIAENEAERQKGLMYRPYLSDSAGMLFIFDESSPQSFW